MPSEAADKKPVRVTILNQTLTLLAAGDPREVELLAQSVDDLMTGIATRSPNADTTRVAILACLHLADRLRTLEADVSGLKQRLEEKAKHFAGLLEEAIGEDRRP